MPEFEFEGLDIGGDDSATDEAFAEAFRRADGVTPEEPSDEATPDEQPAADEETEGQPRDDEGRFARTTPEVTDLEEQQAAHEQETAEADEADPEVSAFLAKYGNDPDKALRAAVELSKLQGRQGDELGQLRQELAQLRETVQTPQRPAVPITEALVEELDNLAMQNGEAALARVSQIGDPTGQLTDRVMDIWFATNPRQASAFQASVIAQETERRVRQELEPLAQERSQSAEERAYVEAWNAAKQTRPQIEELAPQMEQILTERPGLARAILGAETIQERALLFADVYDIAAQKAGVVSGEVRQAAEKQIEQEARAARTRATLAKPSAVGSVPGATEKEVSEEDRIKAGILGARNTDILSGFTTE